MLVILIQFFLPCELTVVTWVKFAWLLLISYLRWVKLYMLYSFIVFSLILIFINF
jgi:hypothetical protein